MGSSVPWNNNNVYAPKPHFAKYRVNEPLEQLYVGTFSTKPPLSVLQVCVHTSEISLLSKSPFRYQMYKHKCLSTYTSSTGKKNNFTLLVFLLPSLYPI